MGRIPFQILYKNIKYEYEQGDISLGGQMLSGLLDEATEVQCSILGSDQNVIYFYRVMIYLQAGKQC